MAFFLGLSLVLLGCDGGGGGSDDDTAEADTNGTAGEACAAVAGTPNPGEYTACIPGGSSFSLLYLQGCDECGAGITPRTFEVGSESRCDDNNTSVVVSDDAWGEDGMAFAGSDFASDSTNLGSCAITTHEFATDEEAGTLYWRATVEAHLLVTQTHMQDFTGEELDVVIEIDSLTDFGI